MKKSVEVLSKTAIFYSTLLSVPVLAQNQTDLSSGASAAKPDNAPTSLTASFKTISNVLIFLVGAVAVIVLIIGGLTYVTSTGDPARVKRAKDTILYGIVGVVVALLAYAVVTFVTSSIK